MIPSHLHTGIFVTTNPRLLESTSPTPPVSVEEMKGKGKAGGKAGATKKGTSGKDAWKKPVTSEELPAEGEPTVLDTSKDEVRDRRCTKFVAAVATTVGLLLQATREYKKYTASSMPPARVRRK